jgi:epoxyqueuosine reductase
MSGMDEERLRRLAGHAKAGALKLGFDLVGITSAEPPPHLDVFDRWLATGRHGQMTYLSAERSRRRRTDPREILPGCQSILVVAQNVHRQEPQGKARIAEYARGDDYHDVCRARLQALMTDLQGELGEAFPYRIYVDTGPLLEREFAQRGGLGWIGKNTCLINPERGSFLVLAEVLLGLHLPPDPPFQADRCGSCTRCIEACPTACIMSDRTLDAQLCISYLTIELKDAIPANLRPPMGDWLFGCDICQQVCPWNRFASPTSDPAYRPRPVLEAPEPEDFLSTASSAIWSGLGGSPLRRPTRRGLARNAAVVAGNRADRASVPVLTATLRHDPDVIVRRHAAWALGQIGGADAIEGLSACSRSEVDDAVQGEIQLGLEAGSHAADGGAG